MITLPRMPWMTVFGWMLSLTNAAIEGLLAVLVSRLMVTPPICTLDCGLAAGPNTKFVSDATPLT